MRPALLAGLAPEALLRTGEPGHLERAGLRADDLAHVHAPVDCSQLEPAHYEVLRGVLRAFEGRKVLVHCAGNVKSSALVQLWRIKEKGEDRERLTEELQSLDWHEPKWFAYLDRMSGQASP